MSDDLAERLREVVANELRNVYILERTSFDTRLKKRTGYVFTPPASFDGGESSEGRSYKPIWPKLATTVLREGLDPVLFIRAQFQGTTTHPPSASRLLSRGAIARARRFQRSDGAAVKVALRVQIDTWATSVIHAKDLYGWSDPDIWEHVLCNESLGLSALFRYCQARSIKLKRMRPIRKRYRIQAFLQYLRNPKAYDRSWGMVFPEGFKAEASEVGISLGLYREETD